MNQSEFLAITFILLKAREKSRVQGAIGFSFPSHWLKSSGARFFRQSLGSLRNDDGNGDDKATNQCFDWLNEEK